MLHVQSKQREADAVHEVSMMSALSALSVFVFRSLQNVDTNRNTEDALQTVPEHI